MKTLISDEMQFRSYIISILKFWIFTVIKVIAFINASLTVKSIFFKKSLHCERVPLLKKIKSAIVKT